MRSLILIALLTGTALPVAAQDSTAASEAQRARERILTALGIPRRAEEIRKAGAPDSSVSTILDILNKKRLPPEEVDEILVAERDAVREHGPTDNFGAFVQARLDQGLRGRELAAAIRAEHAARGKGHGNAKGGPPGAGKPEDAARGGKPDDAGAAGKAKRPDDAGAAGKGKRPDDAGAAKKGGPPESKGQGNKRPTI